MANKSKSPSHEAKVGEGEQLQIAQQAMQLQIAQTAIQQVEELGYLRDRPLDELNVLFRSPKFCVELLEPITKFLTEESQGKPGLGPMSEQVKYIEECIHIIALTILFRQSPPRKPPEQSPTKRENRSRVTGE